MLNLDPSFVFPSPRTRSTPHGGVLVAALGLVLAAALPAAAEGDRADNAWITVKTTQWKVEAETGAALGVTATTTLPKGSLVQLVLRFGEEIVGQGTLEFVQDPNLLGGSVGGLSRALPPGEYWLTVETHLTHQPPNLAPAWTAAVGLVQRTEVRIPVRLGTAEDETIAHQREVEAWVAWFQKADPLLQAVQSAVTGANVPDAAVVRGISGDLEQSTPVLYAASYLRGLRERATMWLRKVDQFQSTLESSMARDGHLPKSAKGMLQALEKSYTDLKQFAGITAEGVAKIERRIGGAFGDETSGIRVTCSRPGWSWVETDEGGGIAVLNSQAAAWTGCRIVLHTAKDGSEAALSAFLDRVLAGVEKAKVVSIEPPTPGDAVKTTAGRKFSWNKDQTGYGLARAFLSHDGRMAVLVALSSVQRWTEFQPIAAEVMKSVSFRSSTGE